MIYKKGDFRLATESFAEFTLIGTGFNPDEVTMLLRIKPTETWRFGDLVHQKAIIRLFETTCQRKNLKK
jgi:hypothetical protein